MVDCVQDQSRKLHPVQSGWGGARIALDTVQSGWEGEALSSGKLKKRADLRCILEKEPKGLGVGRGREKGK